MVSTGVADYKVLRMRPPKGNIHTVISFFRITTGANIFETLHLQLKNIAYTDTF